MQVKSAWPLPAHNVVADLEIYLIHWPTTPPICISRLSLNAGDIFTGRLPHHMERGRTERNGPDRDPRARNGPARPSLLVVIFVGHVRILSTFWCFRMHLLVVMLIAHPIIPSGKHTKNYGKSSFLIGTSTISMAIFNSYVSWPGGNSHESTRRPWSLGNQRWGFMGCLLKDRQPNLVAMFQFVSRLSLWNFHVTHPQ